MIKLFRCPKCNKQLRFQDFYPSKHRSTGRMSYCKKCHREHRKKKYIENPEWAKNYRKEYIKKNPEKVRQTNRSYRRANPDRVRASNHIYRAKNRKAYSDSLKKRKSMEVGSWSYKQWGVLVWHYSPTGKCLWCGRIRKLTVDHVIPISKNGPNTIDNLQPLCGSCNCTKKEKCYDFRPDNGELARMLLKYRER